MKRKSSKTRSVKTKASHAAKRRSAPASAAKKASAIKKTASHQKPVTQKATVSAKKTSPPPTVKQGLVDKQPQSKQQAAVANGMFLYTDDAWSQRYFDRNDLHCMEREVFG